jgi:glycosyltransferase XagB
MNSPQIRLLEPKGLPKRPAFKRQLGRMLVERGLIKTSDVLVTLGHQRISDMQLGQLLLAQGLIAETDLFQTLALQNDVLFIDETETPADFGLQKQLEPHECLRLQAVPWMRQGSATVLATSAPEHFAQAAAMLPAHMHPVIQAIASPSDINDAIRAGGDIALAKRAETLVPEHLSCRTLPAQLRTILALALPLLAIALSMHWLSFAGLYRAVFGFAIAMVCTGITLKTVAASLHLFSNAPKNSLIPVLPDKLPRVSLLVPLHDESDILNALLRRIGMLMYPKSHLDVLIVVEADDAATRDHLEASQLPIWMRVLIVPPGQITTKPRALNYALPFCRGEIVGIYDAEDAPHPEQINDVVATFHVEPKKVACIQAVLDFYNARSNALSRFFAIEYATWFRLILPGVARMGFAVPLGGTSVFFRRDVLEALHGWDAHNVTEDADLGIRLARAGYQTKLIKSVTLEEANNKAWPWIKQRSRWLKGYLITYFTHMRRPLRLLFELGAWKFLGFQAFFLSSINQYMLAPLIWSCMLLYFGAPVWMQSALPTEFLSTMMFAFIGMWIASTAVYIIAVSGENHRHLIPWSILMSIYMALGTLAIYKGAWELITKPFYWEKTAHGHSKVDLDQAPSVESASSLSRVTKATEM